MNKPTLEMIYERAKRASVRMLDAVGRYGYLEMPTILRDPVQQQALAMLEGECMIERCGDSDANFRVPYRALVTDQERELARSTRRAAERREIDEGSTPTARTAAMNAASRQGKR